MHVQKTISRGLTVLAISLCCLFVYWQQIAGNSPGVSVIPQSLTGSTAAQDPYKCKALTTTGSWSKTFHNLQQLSRSDWRPSGCMLHTYTPKDIEHCLGCGRMVFIGDSAIRQTFWAAAAKLNKTRSDNLRLSAPKHEDLAFRYGCSKLHFLWDPFLNLTSTTETLQLLIEEYPSASSANATDTVFVLIGVGLWHARHLGDGYLEAFNSSIRRVIPFLQPKVWEISMDSLPPQNNLAGTQYFAFAPLLPPMQEDLDPERAATLTPDRIERLNDQLSRIQRQESFNVFWSFFPMLEGHKTAYERGGIHVVERIASIQANIVFNLRCNGGSVTHYPFDRTCCAPMPIINNVQILVLAHAFLATSVVLLYLLFDTFRGKDFPPSSSGFGCSKILQASAVLALVLIYCFAADRTTFLSKVSKIRDQSDFLTLTGLTLFTCLFTLRRSRSSLETLGKAYTPPSEGWPLLSRQQTEEWKGWMQITILFYHYFGMSKVLWIYQFARLTVASYLFMTGYGHTLFFLKTNNFSLRRVSAVLLRLNLLSCALPYVMGTDYDFYYFPALSSLWFLVVYATLTIGKSRDFSLAGIGFRVVVSALLIRAFLIWPGILEAVFALVHTAVRMNINVSEFRFRVSLDLYIVYVGMIFGAVHLKLSGLGLGSRAWGWQRLPSSPLLARTGICLFALVVLVLYGVFCSKFADKSDYNKWHPVTSPLPVLAFIALRNATSELRACHVHAFAWIGRCSLEMYILQYHVWLAADTKGLLRLPVFDNFQPISSGIIRDLTTWIEFAIITSYFIWASWGVGRATATISAWMASPIMVEHDLIGPNFIPHRGRRIRMPVDPLKGRSYGTQWGPLVLLGCFTGLNWLWDLSQWKHLRS